MPAHRRAYASHPVVHGHAHAEPYEFDPEPSVPTLEEIELADELRHDLELKYLGKSDPFHDSSLSRSYRGPGEDDWD
jgi:hypothetical protein